MQKRLYFDRIAPNYDALYEDDISIRENLMVTDYLNAYPLGRCLDLGCGTGLLWELYVPDQYIGLDLSPKMLQQARAKYGFLDFVQGDIERLPFGDGVFDSVICLYSSIAYTDCLKNGVLEASRVLRDGGVAFIMVYSRLRHGLAWKRRVFDSRGYRGGGLLANVVTARQIRGFCSEAGLKGRVIGLNFCMRLLSDRIDSAICRLIPDLGYTLIYGGEKNADTEILPRS